MANEIYKTMRLQICYPYAALSPAHLLSPERLDCMPLTTFILLLLFHTGIQILNDLTVNVTLEQESRVSDRALRYVNNKEGFNYPPELHEDSLSAQNEFV